MVELFVDGFSDYAKTTDYLMPCPRGATLHDVGMVTEGTAELFRTAPYVHATPMIITEDTVNFYPPILINVSTFEKMIGQLMFYLGRSYCSHIQIGCVVVRRADVEKEKTVLP